MMEYAGVQADESSTTDPKPARRRCGKQCRALCEVAGPPGIHPTVVMHGDPSLLLVQQEQEPDCDLIVMGSKGTTRWKTCCWAASPLCLAQSQCDVLVSVKPLATLFQE